jgi:hypothetical protein
VRSGTIFAESLCNSLEEPSKCLRLLVRGRGSESPTSPLAPQTSNGHFGSESGTVLLSLSCVCQLFFIFPDLEPNTLPSFWEPLLV